MSPLKESKEPRTSLKLRYVAPKTNMKLHTDPDCHWDSNPACFLVEDTVILSLALRICNFIWPSPQLFFPFRLYYLATAFFCSLINTRMLSFRLCCESYPDRADWWTHVPVAESCMWPAGWLLLEDKSILETNALGLTFSFFKTWSESSV